MSQHSEFEARRIAVELEILTPPFPDDVEHFEDGSWACSHESFVAMSRSYSRFGFTLSYDWSFDTLYDNFCFILRAACLIPTVESAASGKRYGPAITEYLLAVKKRDPRLIAPALAAAMAEGFVDELDRATPVAPRPKGLYLVK